MHYERVDVCASLVGMLRLAFLLPRPLFALFYADIFAFGLCMLELITLKQLDPQHCHNLQELINDIPDDPDCRQFVER